MHRLLIRQENLRKWFMSPISLSHRPIPFKMYWKLCERISTQGFSPHAPCGLESKSRSLRQVSKCRFQQIVIKFDADRFICVPMHLSCLKKCLKMKSNLRVFQLQLLQLHINCHPDRIRCVWKIKPESAAFLWPRNPRPKSIPLKGIKWKRSMVPENMVGVKNFGWNVCGYTVSNGQAGGQRPDERTQLIAYPYGIQMDQSGSNSTTVFKQFTGKC